MKKLSALVLAALLAVVLVLTLTGCVSNDNKPTATEAPAATEAPVVTEAPAAKLTIAIPNDATNEGRALLLLQSAGYLTLKEEAGIVATTRDILEYKANIEIIEVAAELLPSQKADVDYAIINNNFALSNGLNPSDGLLIESADSPYVNVISVNAGNEEDPRTKALVAAVSSQKVADFFAATYPKGEAIFVVANPTDGYDPTVDYAALAGTTIVVGATPDPHAQVLKIAKEILAEKNITLEIVEFTDYIYPNIGLNDGSLFANYFAHQPYQDNFNAENGTNFVTAAGIHVEPMAMYGGKQATLDALNK